MIYDKYHSLFLLLSVSFLDRSVSALYVTSCYALILSQLVFIGTTYPYTFVLPLSSLDAVNSYMNDIHQDA